jgi:4-amino-4-deoxy-L-arabinose transferase-like glycosyltransferase
MLAWLGMILLIGSAYGWAARWLSDDVPLRICLTLALGIGALTLAMFWLSLVGIIWQVALILLSTAVLLLPGWRLRRHLHLLTLPSTWTAYEWGALIAVLAVAAAVLFNAVYWPFSRTDAVDIYHAQALEMTASRALLPLTGADSLYRAYPMGIQLGYTFAYLLAGWSNEYLARLIPALLSLGCLPAVYVLGRMIGGRTAALLAMLLLALTPTFGRWASAGYVDLPMAFFYSLSVIFCYRLAASHGWQDALLAGMMMGLAAWTKNAALVGIGLMGVWLVGLWVLRRIDIRLVIISLAACAFVAAPWYVRNLIGAGFLMPATAWVDQAEPTLDSLLILVTHPEIFGIPGAILLISWAKMTLDAARQRTVQAILLVWFTVPFFAVWWLFASYDPRFLLLFLPLLTVIGGVTLAQFLPRLPQRRWMRIVTAAVVGALTLYSMWISIEFKDNILRDPFMDDAAKQQIVAGD